jgi:acetyltransferase-like isoleucine patch superfamily enzyme
MTKLKYIFFAVINRLVLSQRLQFKVDRLAYERVIEKYKSQGATIGKNTLIIDTKLSSSSKGDQFFIGDNCTITGATLLGHDASPTLHIDELVIFKESFRKGSRRSYRSPVIIGNNVFIGWGSIILPGVEIGDNCVIGAGSVVSKSIPPGMVAAGNPARVLKSTNDYAESYRRRLKEEPSNF